MLVDVEGEVMTKNIINSALVVALVLGTAQFAFADGMPYEPVFESAPINESLSTGETSAALKGSVEDANKLQNALLQLDSAQVDIRNTLVQYKNEYAEIDTQYKVIKTQRKSKKQQVKNTEKRIKTIDKTKEKIRRSM